MSSNLNGLPSRNISKWENEEGCLLKSWVNSYKTSCRSLIKSLRQSVLILKGAIQLSLTLRIVKLIRIQNSSPNF